MSPDVDTIKDARKRVGNKFGKALENKASDKFCLGFGLKPETAGFADFAEAMPTVQIHAAVMEFAKNEEKLKSFRDFEEKNRKQKEWKQIQKVCEKLPVTENLSLNMSQMMRQAKIQILRDDFYKTSGIISKEVERRVQNFQPGLQATASPLTPSAVTEACWLNRTMRTWVSPQLLAEIAADDSIERFDLPRRLEAELTQVSMETVSAPKYRKQFARSGKDIIVAVIDYEVSARHPALKDRVIAKKNYSKELWGNPGSHGTAVAGIIAGNSEADGFFGVAPEAVIYNYKVLANNRDLNADDFGGFSAIEQALTDGAHIANCSWGVGPIGDGTSREAVACDTAWDLGMSIVKSAGNRGLDDGELTIPADARGVIVVGATDETGANVQNYSSYGTTDYGKRPHLVAPGGTQTNGILSCVNGGGFGNSAPGTVFCGTSFAAPHVAGILALLLEGQPDLTPDEQLNFLLNDCCSAFNPDNPDLNGKGLATLVKLLNQ